LSACRKSSATPSIYKLIQYKNLRDRLFKKSGGNGIQMLACIEEHIRSIMSRARSPQA